MANAMSNGVSSGATGGGDSHEPRDRHGRGIPTPFASALAPSSTSNAIPLPWQATCGLPSRAEGAFGEALDHLFFVSDCLESAPPRLAGDLRTCLWVSAAEPLFIAPVAEALRAMKSTKTATEMLGDRHVNALHCID